ncbi:NRDE family protein [Lacibacterium aquatile]|uniref:NRDE family protein n=1 Tax=Lacibacterium aquatile TaxID=1168082 RepID=A0ABW5DVG9_9PROT
MCTLVILRRSEHPWPILLAGNRNEMQARTWDPPARHWDNREDIIAGRDHLTDGSWLGLNDTGVAAVLLNREGTLGPLDGKRSRGELVLEALDHPDAVAAVQALLDLDARAYRPFNMVIADNRDAYWLRNDGRKTKAFALPEGVTMITAREANDPGDPRIALYLPRFKEVAPPDPEKGDWQSWTRLLAERNDEDPSLALTFTTPSGYATLSSALLALPAIGSDKPPVLLHANGAPDRADYQSVLE